MAQKKQKSPSSNTKSGSNTKSAAKSAKSSSSSAKMSSPVASASTKPSVVTSVSNKVANVNKRTALTIGGWILLLIVSFVMIDYFVQYLNKGYSAGVVYGDGYTARVSKNEMYSRLEEQFGKQMTDKLLEEMIVERAAKEKDVSVSDDEVEEVVQKAKEELGGEEAYQSALEAYSWTDEVFRTQTRYDLLKKKLLVEDPSDEELVAFFDQYKSVYFSEDATFESTDKDQLTELYRNQKLNDSFGDWYEEELEDVTLKNNYDTSDEDEGYGVLKTTRDILSSVYDQITN